MHEPVIGYRMSGGGNDFIALAEPSTPPTAEAVRRWCTRGLSIGADGLFVLRREEDAVRMDYFNADGGAADLCLNGTRCAARLAVELGWTESAIEIRTGSGSIDAESLDDDRVRLTLEPPADPPERRRPVVAGDAVEGWFTVVGVPQFVVPWTGDLAAAPVGTLGPELRGHSDFGAAGTNVMFTRFLPPHRLEIRSFERGVEAETLACGTGVLAAAATAIADDRFRSPIEALTGGGFILTVDGTVRDGRFERWTLAGDARLIARIEIEPGAASLPRPPIWTPD